MIETGLVYIYSTLPARAFKGCGALVEGGYVATCRHVWRDAITLPNGGTGEPSEVEIEFPFVQDKGSSKSRATVADVCEEPEGQAPDVVLLRPDTIPSRVMTLQLATKERFETGAGRAHTYLASRKRYSTVDGRIDTEAGPDGLRQFRSDQSQEYFFEKGSSGSPVFLKNAQQLAGIIALAELGANAGESHLREAFVVPATTIRAFLVRLQARPVADKQGINLVDLQPILDRLAAQDVVVSDVPARLLAIVEQAQKQATKPVPVSSDGANVDSAIAASRAKLGALDTAGALEVLRTRLVPLLKERAAVERLAFEYDAAKSTSIEVTRLAPNDIWAWIDLGDLYVTTGSLEEAAIAFCNAWAAARRQGDERNLSVSQIKFGDVRMAKGDLKWALALYKAGLTSREALFRRDPTNTRSQGDLSVAYNKIGDVQMRQVDLPGALKSYNDSLAITERLTESDPGNARWQRDLSVAYERIGNLQEAQGNLVDARKSYEDSLAIAEALAHRGPANTEWQRDLSVSYEKIGDVLKAQDDLAGALTSYRVALDLREALMRRDPTNTKWQRDISVSQEKIADVLKAQGDLAGALMSYRAALDVREALMRRDPANTEWQRDLSETRARTSEVLKEKGDLDGALISYPDAGNMKGGSAAVSLRETLLYSAALESNINEPNRPGRLRLESSRSVFDLMDDAVDNPAQLSDSPTASRSRRPGPQ